jgi:drug/metabolite transporter (DMT)-like permease
MNRRAGFQLLLLAALWGAVYPLIATALQELSPAVVVFVRVLCAALLLLPLSIHQRALTSLWAHPRAIIETVLVQSTAPLLLLTYGQKYVSSSLASILVAAQPLFVAVLAYRWAPADKPQGWRGLAGLAVGFAGIVSLFGLDLRGGWTTLAGGVLVLGAALGYAIGSIMIHNRYRHEPSLGVATSAMLVTTVTMLAPCLFSIPRTPPTAGVIIAMMVLGLVCTGMTLVLFYTLITQIGPTRASLAFYLSPAFAVVASVAFLHEHLRFTSALGLCAIVAGSALASQEHEQEENDLDDRISRA